MADYIVELCHTARIRPDTGGLVGCVMAKIHDVPERLGRRWPTPAAQPRIALVGADEAEVLRMIGLWLEEGAPTMAEARAKAEGEGA